MGNVPRVLVTQAACKLIEELQERHGPLMFHQSGGCCDGSQPMCFEAGDFKVGGSDVQLGTVCGFPFWMAKDQFEYWQNTQLTLDVTKGRGSSFSIEIPTGNRFLIRSRVFTNEEVEHLEKVSFSE